MSEQIQNHNLPTPEELQARDDAIFNTVNEFHSELEQPKVQEFEGIGEDDAKYKADVDAIFDNRKAEIGLDPLSRKMVDMAPGSGRHRKEFDLDENKAGLQRDALSSITDRRHRGLPEEHREAFGIAAHASPDDVAKRQAKKGKKDKLPEELKEGEAGEGIFDPDALARAEEVARTMPTRADLSGQSSRYDNDELPSGTAPYRGVTGGISAEEAADLSIDENEPAATAPAPTAPARGRHRAPKGRRAPRAIPDGQVGGNSSNDYAMTRTGHHLIAPQPEANTGNADNDNEATPVVVTPEARRRDRIAAHLGRMGVDVEGIRGEWREMSDAWRQLRESKRGGQLRTAATGKLAMVATGVRSGASHAAGATGKAARTAAGTAKALGTAAKEFGSYGRDLMYRKDEADLTDKERKARPYVKGMAVTAGALALATAVLGANQLVDNGSAEASPARSSSPSAEASQPAFGPQTPKTSETPTPSASATQKVTPKPSATPTTGPTAIPKTPDFSNKPHVEEPQGPTGNTEKQQTKDLDHETISFITKDGKVVSATAKLKSGGSIFEAGHDAGLTDTQVANAVNEAGISSQRAEQLPVGQQIDFTQQADGSYTVNLR